MKLSEHGACSEEGQWQGERWRSSRDQTHVQTYSTSKKEEEACYGLGSTPKVRPSHVTLEWKPHCPSLSWASFFFSATIFPSLYKAEKEILFVPIFLFNALLFMIGPPWVDRWFSLISSKLECYCHINFFVLNYWPIWQIFTCL